MKLSKYDIGFIGLLLAHITVLLFVIDNYSISAKEAAIYFSDDLNVLTLLTNFSTSIFGQNDYALRVPFVLFYAGSAILLYLLTDDYFRLQRDRLISILIFMLLPGINSAALLVNESIIVVFGTLLYLYLYKLREQEHYYLLVLFLFIDNSFAILFLALFFYSLHKKDNMLLIISLSLFGFSMSLYGFTFDGVPRGYFLDTFAIYATIFSPVLFLYFFYSLYRIGIKWEKDLYWYISMTALGLSLVFSLRQKIAIDDFAPFIVISIPIMVRLFIHSLRVRLKEFRYWHYLMLRVTLGVLIMSFLVFIFNKTFYVYIKNPASHIAHDHYVAKELALKLKELHVDGLTTNDARLAIRLKFYGIKEDKNRLLSERKIGLNDRIITIAYHNKVIKRFYLINVNNVKLKISQLNN
ncbi:MAG: glycosyltransferase family 39 protein [Arcobacteraceae bacterium]